MLIDELKEQLKTLEPDIVIIKTYWKNADVLSRLAEIEQLRDSQDFWQRTDQAELLKEIQQLSTLKQQYDQIIRQQEDLNELLDLFSQDEQELKKIESDIRLYSKAVNSFKILLLLQGAQDKDNCFVSINAGAGGTESQDWASILLRMYVRFCERQKFDVSVLDYQAAEEAGIKSATLFIKGLNAYGLLKCEQGVHRLVRISPFDANKRRHTSFAAVNTTPEVPEVAIDINQNDLRIDTYRAGGAGGQHVNKTESAVRITHIPSGIVVQCQNERSQGQNKETALKMLKSKLAAKYEEERQAKLATAEKKKIEWGSQIRSYVLHPYKMVKDHRTEFESPQPDLVLDGDLLDFIESYLLHTSR